MQNIIFLIPLVVFLYMLYKLVKDDYVFIRKGLLPEQVFDTTVFVVFFGVIFARFLSLLFQQGFTNNVFFTFFSSHVAGLSLLGFLYGALGVLYYIAKKKKIACGRFFDFFTLSFLPALTVGFFLEAIFTKGYTLLIMLAYGIIYGILTICFFQFFKPQLLSRTLKEGNITLFFLMIFSLFSLIDTLFLQQLGKIIVLHPGNLFAVFLLLGSIVLYFKQEGARRRG